MRIETTRLVLEPLTSRHLSDYVAMHAEAPVLEFMPPVGRDAAIERLARNERDWSERGHGLLAIHDKSGRFLGRTGLVYWPQFDETEVGWVLRTRATGRGYATEATRAVIDWAFGNLPAPYLTAMVRPDNERSLAVARRLGFRRSEPTARPSSVLTSRTLAINDTHSDLPRQSSGKSRESSLITT